MSHEGKVQATEKMATEIISKNQLEIPMKLPYSEGVINNSISNCPVDR